MTAPKPSHVQRFWLSEWSLSALLVLLLVDGFLLGPFLEMRESFRILQPILFSLLLISGAITALRSRALMLLVGTLVVATLVVRWTGHLYPSMALDRTNAALSLACVAALTAVILVQVFRAGDINVHRIQGAIAVYLLLAFGWAFAYTLVALGNPGAFNFSTAGLDAPALFRRLSYYSIVTLTTVGYGDITPVSAAARSLAGLEALTGQLFPAILLARLVSMELFRHQQSGR